MGYSFEAPPPDRQKGGTVSAHTVWGQSLRETPVPVWTAAAEHHPFVRLHRPDTGEPIGLNYDMLSCGLLALADPGGGKTNLFNFLLSALLDSRGAQDKIFIFDTKGDYLQEFGAKIPPKERVVIGIGEEYRSITAVHNIFGEIMPRGEDGRLRYTADCDTDALSLCAELFDKMQSDSQPIFPNMAMLTMTAVLIYFMRAYSEQQPELLNNRTLVQYLKGSTMESLTAMLDTDCMADQRSVKDYISGKNSQTQGVVSYLGTVIRKLFIDAFSASDPNRSFSMRELLRSPGRKVVFIEYDLNRGGALAPMYGVLIDRIMANALGGRQRDRFPCYILLDEMLLLPKLEHLSDCLTFGRSQGVRVACGLQNVPGVVDLYGEAGAKRMLASFQNLFVFHLSDSDTRQFVVDRLGRNYQLLTCFGKDTPVSREGHLAEDWHLLELGLGEAVVVLKGEAPFFFRLPKYE